MERLTFARAQGQGTRLPEVLRDRYGWNGSPGWTRHGVILSLAPFIARLEEANLLVKVISPMRALRFSRACITAC